MDKQKKKNWTTCYTAKWSYLLGILVAGLAFGWILGYSYYGFQPKLIVGVISSRDHFANRNAIRAFLNDSPNDAAVRFVIGAPCDVPPRLRKEEYSCTEQQRNGQLPAYFQNVACAPSEADLNKLYPLQIGFGFGFKVRRRLDLTHLGVLSCMVSAETVVVFKDPEEEFVQLPFTRCDVIERGYCFVRLEEYFNLPEHFEGEIVVKTYNSNSNCSCEKLECHWAKNLELQHLFVQYQIPQSFHGSECSMVAGRFHAPPIQSLNVSNLKSEWKKVTAETDKLISQEIDKHQDIIVVPTCDVYRNLPKKILNFISWCHDELPGVAVLKMDDDTFVNLALLLTQLQTFDNNSPSLHSKFRYYESVTSYGKWAEHQYTNLAYPAFPSGAAYLLSGCLVSTINDVKYRLRSFQGEDVSMGIWTESLLANCNQDTGIKAGVPIKKIDMPCWFPSEKCKESFFVPQLSVEELRKYSSP